MFYSADHRPSLLEVGDTIVILDIEHTVAGIDGNQVLERGHDVGRFWLHVEDHRLLNDAVFDRLHLDPGTLASATYFDFDGVETGAFPEAKTLDELTAITNALLNAAVSPVKLEKLRIDCGVVSYDGTPLIRFTTDGEVQLLKVDLALMQTLPFGIGEDDRVILSC